MMPFKDLALHLSQKKIEKQTAATYFLRKCVFSFRQRILAICQNNWEISRLKWFFSLTSLSQQFEILKDKFAPVNIISRKWAGILPTAEFG